MPRDIPQHNHMAELGFAVISNKGGALLIRASFPWKYCFHLYRGAFKTATDHDGLGNSVSEWEKSYTLPTHVWAEPTMVKTSKVVWRSRTSEDCH